MPHRASTSPASEKVANRSLRVRASWLCGIGTTAAGTDNRLDVARLDLPVVPIVAVVEAFLLVLALGMLRLAQWQWFQVLAQWQE